MKTFSSFVTLAILFASASARPCTMNASSSAAAAAATSSADVSTSAVAASSVGTEASSTPASSSASASSIATASSVPVSSAPASSAPASVASSAVLVAASSVASSTSLATSAAAAVTSSAAIVASASTSAATSSVVSTKAASATSAAVSSTISSDAGTCSGDLTKFTYFGVNESGAEFGTAIPGTLGTDYIWPAESSIDYFVDTVGMNFFRVPFLMERLASTSLAGAFDATYLASLTDTVNYITAKGASVAFEPHNYMRYNGAIITSTSDFQSFWTNLANEFIDNDKVIFDLMNEPYGIDATTVASLMQAGIDGIRSTGATQLILVEGTSYTGAWTWTSSGNAAAFTSISDPQDNMAIEMHQYLDSNGSGTSDVCVSTTIGAERLADATTWLQTNGLKGFLGEIGAGNNSDCMAAVFGALCSMQQAGGVWIGASWWAAGQWWGDYFMSIEPTTGVAVADMLPQALEPFM